MLSRLLLNRLVIMGSSVVVLILPAVVLFIQIPSMVPLCLSKATRNTGVLKRLDELDETTGLKIAGELNV